MNNNWINLRHEGGENDQLAYVVVSVEIDGQRHEAIRELKGNYFDHSVNMDSLPVPLVPATDNADLRRQLGEAQETIATLREALVHQLYDMHMPSMRPCGTCDRSRKALGADVRFGCGYRRAENDTPEVALSKIAALDAGKETGNG
jgi:hypothetical protein